MLRGTLLSFLMILFAAPALGAQRQDYFTEEEADQIREARGNEVFGGGKELQHRVPTYFKLADKRLVALGLKDKSQKEKDQERKAREDYEKQVKAAQKAGRKPPPEPDLPDAYLLDFTRSELLRGYSQALEEVMSNIDDVYSRKLDVRDALESLERYCREQLPVLKAFQPKNAAETAALEDAIETTERALRDSQAALEIVPKTEQSGRKP